MPLVELYDGEEVMLERGDYLVCEIDPDDPDEPEAGQVVVFRCHDDDGTMYVDMEEGTECGYGTEGFYVDACRYSLLSRRQRTPQRSGKSPEEEKTLALQLLDKLSVADPHACVAGGALCSWKLGKSCNDLDVWITLPEYMDTRQQSRHLNSLLGTSISRKGSSDPNNEDGSIRNVFKTRYEGITVDLIVVRGDPWERYLDFPYSHTQAMLKADGEVTSSAQFDLTHSWKIITKLQPATKPEYVAKVEKLAEKLEWEISPSPSNTLELVTAKMQQV